MSTNGRIAIALVVGLIVGSLFSATAIAGVTIAHRVLRTVVAGRPNDVSGPGPGMMGRSSQGYGRGGMMGRSYGSQGSGSMNEYMDRYRDSNGEIDFDAMHQDMLGSAHPGPTGGSNGSPGYCY